jgi:hypothetical protein
MLLQQHLMPVPKANPAMSPRPCNIQLADRFLPSVSWKDCDRAHAVQALYCSVVRTATCSESSSSSCCPLPMLSLQGHYSFTLTCKMSLGCQSYAMHVLFAISVKTCSLRACRSEQSLLVGAFAATTTKQPGTACWQHAGRNLGLKKQRQGSLRWLLLPRRCTSA